MEREESHIPALVALSHSAMERGSITDALRYAQATLVIEPTNAQAHVVIGSVLSTPGLLDVQRARWHLKQAMADSDVSRLARVLLAELTLTTDWAMAGGEREMESKLALATAADESRRRLRADDQRPLPERERIELQMFLARCALAGGDLDEAGQRLTLVQQDEPNRRGLRGMQARVFWLRGLEGQAKREFDAALEADPSPINALQIAAFYERVHQPALAFEVISAARLRHPDDFTLRLHEARGLIDEGKTAEGEARLRDLREMAPDENQVSIWLADAILRDGGRRDEAEAVLREAIDLTSADPMAALRLADLLLDPRGEDNVAANDVAEAQAIVDRYTAAEGREPPLVPDSPADIYAGYVRGKALLVQRQFTEAIAELGRIADRNPEDPFPHLLLARAHEERGEYVLAGLELTAALRTGATTRDVYLRRARANLARIDGAPEVAAEDALRALALDLGSTQARIVLSRAWMRHAPPETERAEKMLRQALDEVGSDPALRLELARVLVLAGKHAEADAEARALLTAVPEAIAAQATELRAAIADLNTGEHLSPAARTIFEEALRAHADSARWHTRFALLMLRAGERDAAERWARIAIERDAHATRPRRILFECVVGNDSTLDEARDIVTHLQETAPKAIDSVYVKGKLALRDARNAEAVFLLSEVVERAPLDLEAAYFLARALADEGDLKAARRVLERVIRIRPSFVEARVELADVAFREGRAALRDDRLEEALDALHSVLGTDARHVAARAAITETYLRAAAGGDALLLARARKEADALVAVLESRLRAENASGESFESVAGRTRLGAGLTLLGTVAEAQQDWGAVVDVATRHVELYPDDLDGIRRRANALATAGRAAESTSALEDALQEHPEEWELLRALLPTYEGVGRVADAISAVERWLVDHPRHADAHMALGWLRLGTGDGDAAEKELTTALDLDPHLEGAQLALIDLLLRRDDAAAAQTLLQRLTESVGERPALTFQRGRIAQANAQDSSDGLAIMVRAYGELGADASPRNAVTLLTLATRWGGTEQIRIAVRAFLKHAREATRTRPGSPERAHRAEAFALAGAALHRLGDFPRAEYAYQMAIELNPDDARVLNNLAELIAGDRKRRVRRELDLAEQYARRAIDLSPTTPGFRDTLGFTLAAQERPADARTEFAAAAAMMRERLATLEARQPRDERVEALITHQRSQLAASLVRDALAALDSGRYEDAKRLREDAETSSAKIVGSQEYQALAARLR